MRATALIGMAPGLDPSTYDQAEIERYGVGQGVMITFRSLLSHWPLACQSPLQLTSSTISNNSVYHKNYIQSVICPSFTSYSLLIPTIGRLNKYVPSQPLGSCTMSFRSFSDLTVQVLTTPTQRTSIPGLNQLEKAEKISQP